MDKTLKIYHECERFDPQIFSDLYKDAYGFRPRFSLDDYSYEELDELWDETLEAQQEEMKREEELQERNFKIFKNRLDKMMSQHNISKATALRWMIDADMIEEDIELYGYCAACFQWGLSFNKAEYLERIIKLEK